MSNDLRTRFPRGCRITLDLETLAAQQLHSRPPYPGTVIGYSRDIDALWVQLDGRTSRHSYGMGFLQRLADESRDDPAPPAAGEAPP
jgi:hypothetical protein